MLLGTDGLTNGFRNHLHSLVAGAQPFPAAKIVTDLSKRISLPSEYIPMPLRDKKVINKIVTEYAASKKAKADEVTKRKALPAAPPNTKGPAFNTRFHALKRGAFGSKSNPICL